MLDYYGFSYDVVEVNSVTKKQLKWSNYKKVPIVVADGAGDSGFLVSLLVHCVCVCECVCVCACTHAGGYGLRAIQYVWLCISFEVLHIHFYRFCQAQCAHPCQ